MNAFLNNRNTASLTGLIELTANSISLYDQSVSSKPENIKNIFIPRSDISIAEPYEVQLDEFGDNIITMYQFIGPINDTKVGGLESLLNYMNENFFSKDEPAVNEHHYHITRKQYNQDFSTHNIYNIDKSKKYKINNHRYNDNHIYNKKHYITNDITNNITKKNIITNNDNILNIKKDFSTKNYITNILRSSYDNIEHNLYKKYDNRTFNNTNNTYKHINNYNNDITNNYKINRVSNVKKTYYNFNDNNILNKTNTVYSNDTVNITKNTNLFNITDNNYNIKKINNTSNITHNITKYINNNYENNIVKKINNDYSDVIFHNKKIHNKKNYYNFYNDTFNFRKIENISLSQQTDITNNIIETNQQTIDYIDNNYINNNNIATIILNPTPSLTDNYIWIPETTDNVVPGLDSLLTYLQSKYATINALQNAIANINSTLTNEISNIQTEIENLEVNTQQNVSKNLSFHTSHTDFMYQRNNTNHNYDNRRYYVTQQNYFTYQRKGSSVELQLQIQNLQSQINNLQTQINNYH
jgi:hypothetical protein